MRRPSPSTVIASVALFFSLTGAASAATAVTGYALVTGHGHGQLSIRQARPMIYSYASGPRVEHLRMWGCHRATRSDVWCRVKFLDVGDWTECDARGTHCSPVGAWLAGAVLAERRHATVYCTYDPALFAWQRCGAITARN